jgi:hypothetical protein
MLIASRMGDFTDLNPRRKGVKPMDPDIRLLWLRRVLVVKSIVTIFVWGLPALLTGLLFVSFLILMPREGQTLAT